MRNTISTRVARTRHWGACAALLGVMTLPATAADFPRGCFARLYDDAHLAKAPEQSVVQMMVTAEPYPTELLDGWLLLKVTFRGQGIGASNVTPGLWYNQQLYCREDGGPRPPDWTRDDGITCFAECDGGAMQVASWDGSKLELRTGGLYVHEQGGECEGNAYLAPEGRESVVFRLHPVDQSFCADK